MICPSTRLLIFAVLKGVTEPRPVRKTGTSCCCTLATATETARGAAACAFCCLESPLLVQAVRQAMRAARNRAARGRGMRRDFSKKLQWMIFTNLSGCEFLPNRRLDCHSLDVFIVNTVVPTPSAK